MGWFLHSKFVTHLCVLIVGLLAGFATFFYAWTFSRHWPSPTTATGVTKGFAMASHALFSFTSILTWHSIRISSRSIMFGTWASFAFASIVFDSWWFGLMVSRKGFDSVGASAPNRKGVTVAFCVYSGLYAIYRLIVLLFVFHFDVRYNEGLAATMGTATAGPAQPQVIQIAGPPPSCAPHQLPQHPSPYMFSPPTVATFHSLAKKLSMRRRSGGSERQFARLDQREEEALRRNGTSEPIGTKVAGMVRQASRRWWPGTGASRHRSDVPLIHVSLHEEANARRGRGSASLDEEEGQDSSVLFDVTSVGGAASSLDSYDIVSGSDKKAEVRPLDKGKERAYSSSEEEEEDSEDEAQRAYEERRKHRRNRSLV